ncbi:hypothetical protein [Phormidium sp. CCY1219]|uniref:hypothetical protein n=1 Tax=Phormidium sp. CCY1219 TaxID=2886104 RepID=UPI002D1EDA61|nr:hypothetical protein [Phormidium sp. CCY1219]MEB3827440.1 hypothetical protein [Phormidium sp. CCY1219]
MTNVVINGGGGGGSSSYQGSLTIWIAAYIPQARVIFSPPPNGLAFAGDDRGPSGGNGGSSKVWGYAKFNVESNGTVSRQEQKSGVGVTTLLYKSLPFIGDWEPKKSWCPDDEPKLSASTFGNKASISMSADIPNGLLDHVSPDELPDEVEDEFSDLSITYDLNIEVELDGNEIIASVTGTHNKYPAYEVYVGDYLVYEFDDTEGFGGIEPGVIRLARGLRTEKKADTRNRKSANNFAPSVFVQVPDECR